MTGELVLPERRAPPGAPQPETVAGERAPRIAAELGRASGVVAHERAPGQIRGHVVGLGTGRPRMQPAAPSRAEVAGEERGLRARGADTHVDGGRADLHERQRVHVREHREGAGGGRIGDVEPVEPPGGAGTGIAAADHERLLRGVRSAHVHAIEDDAGHVPQDRPGVGGAGQGAQAVVVDDRRAVERAEGRGRRRRFPGRCREAQGDARRASGADDDIAGGLGRCRPDAQAMVARAQVQQRRLPPGVRRRRLCSVRTVDENGRAARRRPRGVDDRHRQRARGRLGPQRRREEDGRAEDERGGGKAGQERAEGQVRRSTYSGRRRPPSWVGAKSAAT